MAFAGRDMSVGERFSAMDESKARFVSKVYSGLTLSLALATVCALIGAHLYATNPAFQSAWPILRFGPMVMLLITWFVRLNGVAGWGFLFAFVAIDGLVLGPILDHVSRTPGGTNTIALALGLTTGIFATLTAYVRYTGKDFSWMGGMLSILTIALLVAGIAVMIFGVSADLRLLLSVAGAVIFSGWILYDTSAVTREYYEDNNVSYAILMLFVDFVGLFMNLLSILNSSDD